MLQFYIDLLVNRDHTVQTRIVLHLLLLMMFVLVTTCFKREEHAFPIELPTAGVEAMVVTSDKTPDEGACLSPLPTRARVFRNPVRNRLGSASMFSRRVRTKPRIKVYFVTKCDLTEVGPFGYFDG